MATLFQSLQLSNIASEVSLGNLEIADFHATGKDGFGFAELDHLRAGHDGLHAAAAQAIHGQCGRLDGKPGF